MDYALLGILATIVTTVGSLTWFISAQFSKVRSLVYELRSYLYARIEETESKISNKLEYHEKHDDQRFEAITKDLWEIRLRNASKDREMSELVLLKRELAQEKVDRAQENQA